MSLRDVKDEIETDVQDAFETVITFAYKFGETRRKAGIVSGSTRDTLDLGELADSVNVTVNQQGINVSIGEGLTYGNIVMEQRPELEDLIVENIDIGYYLENLIEEKFKGKI